MVAGEIGAGVEAEVVAVVGDGRRRCSTGCTTGAGTRDGGSLKAITGQG